MAWLDPLRAQLDVLTGRFEAGHATTPADREGVFAVLDAVRRGELNRVHGASALESAAFADREVRDALFYVKDLRDGGKIVGCMRGTHAGDLTSAPASVHEYALDAWPREELDKVGVATRLAVLRPYRKTAASLALLQFMYVEGLKLGYLWCLLTCEPGLVGLYRRVGFRPHARVHASPTGGFRLPMVLVNHDEAHLAAVGSPLLGPLRRQPRPFPARGLAWWRDFQAAHPDLDVGIHRMGPEHLPEALSDGLSVAARTALAENGLVLRCETGQRVVVRDDGSRSLGVVVSGALDIVVDGRRVAQLGPGELFGELSLILGSRRTADVIAVNPDTTVAMLSQSALDRIKAPTDQARLWQNLSRVLARRLLELRDPR